MQHVYSKTPSLLVCLALDLVGYFTYAIPVLGEFGDLIWAPVSGLIFFRLFGGWKGVLGGFFAFAEELLPFTDFVPSFTLGWLAQRFLFRKQENTLSIKARLPVDQAAKG